MLRRLPALVLAALALVATAGCADDVSPALRIDDTTISNDDFLDEVEEWAGNPAAIDPQMLVSRAPGSYPGDVVRQLLQQRLDFELARVEFEARGLELTDAMREDALVALFGDPSAAEGAFQAFSPEFRTAFVDDVARQVALQNELGADAYGQWQAEAYQSFDIEVNPRYGTWDEGTRSIIAAGGPTAPSTTAP